MPTVNDKEVSVCFVQAATTSEAFSKAIAVRHLVELKFPLNSPWELSVDFSFWSMRRRKKCKKAGIGRLAVRNKDGGALLSSFSNDTWRVNQPGTGLKVWTSLIPLLHVESLQVGRTFLLSKEKPVQSWQTLSTAVATTENTMFDAQPENVSNKVLSGTTPNKPWCFPNENINFGCGWSRRCVEMVWRQKMWQARDLWQLSSPEKSEKLYKEWFDTPSRNLTQQSIEVHFSVLCSCHQDRITSGGQWTSKTKVSVSSTRHSAQMNFVKWTVF